MATSIFELFGTIMVDNKEANKSLADTDSKAATVAKALGNGAKAAAKFAAGVATAATGAIAGMTKLASSSASTMDEIDKQSQKMNISAESYQEWSHAMDLSGMSIDTMKSGMKALQKAMTGVDEEGNTTGEEFEKLGISLTNADGSMRSAEEIMNEAIAKLADMGDGAERTAIATKLFGRAGTEMAPMLNQGSAAIEAMKQEAHDLGLVFSDESVKAGATLNDTLTNLKQSFAALKTGLGTSLIPVVQKFAELLMGFLPKIQAIFDRIGPAMSRLFETLMPVIIDLAEQILPVIFDILDALMPVFEDLVKTVLPIFVNLINKLAPVITKIVQTVLPVVQQILAAIMPVLDSIWKVLEPILDLVLGLIDPLLNLATTILRPIISCLQVLNPLFEVLAKVLQPILDLVNLILKPVLDFINFIFGGIVSGIEGVTDSLTSEDGLLGGLGGVVGYLSEGVPEAFELFGNVLNEALGFIGDVFKGIVNFIDDPKQALSDFFDWIQEKTKTVWQSLSQIGEGVKYLLFDNSEDEAANLKAFTDEALRQQRAGTLDTNDRAAMNALRRQFGVPELANGAVIEPNKPFMAVVGDQTRGTNIEAPLATIEQAVANVLGRTSINHTGTIRIEGVTSQGEFVAAADYVVDGLIDELRKESRVIAYG